MKPRLLAVCGVAALLTVVGVARLAQLSRAPARPRPAAPAAIRFEEAAAARGLAFRWNPRPKPLNIMDGFGCGCAFLDYDGDGFQDILLVNEPSPGLFRNLHGAGFEKVTAPLGLDRVRGAWKGCAVGDYDGDGRLDVLLTGYRCLALLKNEGGKRFVDVTSSAGLSRVNWHNWGASAGFMDLDRDGDLDLVVQNYLVWDRTMVQYCPMRGVRVACGPEFHDPERARLLRNDGGRFTDVSRAAGLGQTTGYGMVVGFTDVQGDGLMDFYLGNDGRDADFMVNRGGLRFHNGALENGTATATSGNELAAMGVDWADYNGDGHLDFAVSGFSQESCALFRADGKGSFVDTSEAVGLAGPTFLPLEFGTKFADVDNDGWPDLFFVSGHIFDAAAEVVPGGTFRQRTMLFHNEQGTRFTDIAPAAGPGFLKPLVGRGSATGDWDNDGQVDLLAVDYEGEPLLLHNRSAAGNHWVTLDLRSPAGGNRFAYGARVTLRAGGHIHTGEVSPASSFLSSSDPRLHFGLGASTEITSVTVRWPSGRQEVFHGLPVDRILTLTEGRGFPSSRGTATPTGVP